MGQVIWRVCPVVPNLYTIPPWQPFLSSLASGIFEQYWDRENPLAFADITVLLPTRRAVRSLHRAFAYAFQANGLNSTVLPSIRPIGDVDEDELIFSEGLATPQAVPEMADIPPAIPEIKRYFLLAQLIRAWFDAEGKKTDTANSQIFGEAFAYAMDLTRFLDAAQVDQVELARLKNIVVDRFAEHWQQTVAFLDIIDEHWPAVLDAQKTIDPADRRNRLIEAYAGHLQSSQPTTPIIAAGSTGSIKATAQLLSVIARLPAGSVILPGLDQAMPDKSWAEVDLQHPQYGLKELLTRMEVSRNDVKVWSAKGDQKPNSLIQARQSLIAEALKPVNATSMWRSAVEQFDVLGWAQGLNGLRRLEAKDEHEEAGIIAILMREAYEKPGKKIALVTPDRTLARRVITNLKRWNLDVDDSAGEPFLQSWQGMFLKQIIECVDSGFAPSLFLNVLKHPLCQCGWPRHQVRDWIGLLEIKAFRRLGARVDWQQMRQAVKDDTSSCEAGLIDWITCLEGAFAPLLEIRSIQTSIAAFAEAHARTAEELACLHSEDQAAGQPPFWANEAGEQASTLMRELIEYGNGVEEMSLASYTEVFSTLAARRAVRKAYGASERLSIWGPLEARLQKADMVILGGLNESNWPSSPSPDPWANRPMRAAIGMELPERRIGLSAHDFSQLTANNEVILSRSVRSGGAPTVPARWLLRLDAILEGAGYRNQINLEPHYADWYQQLDAAPDYAPIPSPDPRPPVAVRPRRFSVSEVSTWLRDPYSIYAKKILKLLPLDELEELPTAATFGDCVHRVLYNFVLKAGALNTREDKQKLFSRLAQEALVEVDAWPEIKSVWRVRLQMIGDWFIPYADTLSADHWHEVPGELVWSFEQGDFRLRARADYIEQTAEGLAIMDYKTGRAPSDKEVKAQLEPQLTLEGVIAREGGFEKVPADRVDRLVYVKLAGKPENFKSNVIIEGSNEIENLLLETKQGLLKWVTKFDHQATPYRSRPRVQMLARFGEYDHLARVKEWSASGPDGDDG